jgi:hypothetical protein
MQLNSEHQSTIYNGMIGVSLRSRSDTSSSHRQEYPSILPTTSHGFKLYRWNTWISHNVTAECLNSALSWKPHHLPESLKVVELLGWTIFRSA